MDKHPIPIEQLDLQPFTAFGSGGILLVCGEDVGHANPMTIGWGTFGIMWGRPVAVVMVRPTRYTWEFITRAPDFTVNWMPEEWAQALQVCGTKSGRDLDKFAATGMTPVAGAAVNSPVIAESILTLECRTIYRTDLVAEQMLDNTLQRLYPAKDFHGIFAGEIVAAAGIERFRRT
ncbi:MAG: flavin reductase family protein [Armatimonadota bacterium]